MKQTICDIHQGPIEGEAVTVTVKRGKATTTYDSCEGCLKAFPFHQDFVAPPPPEQIRISGATARHPLGPTRETGTARSEGVPVAPPVQAGVQHSPSANYVVPGAQSYGKQRDPSDGREI